ncbi:hypothetical protein FQY83_07485 [Luteimonas marina]|uniref:Uncharacterized protein n=1 Tax=Luteimonas marina TaxID=488485 RepID=A0A5C5U6H0_9GAMM|nr:hypothetical protein [Luteimonas marina]TWT21195.1 hypothetical protein FQY83_07485 [Luteimonas marina]
MWILLMVLTGCGFEPSGEYVGAPDAEMAVLVFNAEDKRVLMVGHQTNRHGVRILRNEEGVSFRADGRPVSMGDLLFGKQIRKAGGYHVRKGEVVITATLDQYTLRKKFGGCLEGVAGLKGVYCRQ